MSREIRPKKRKRKIDCLSHAGVKVRRWLGALDATLDSINMLQNISFQGFSAERIEGAKRLWEKFAFNLLDSRSALNELRNLIEADMPKPRQGRK